MRSNSDSKSSESGGNGKRKIPKRGPGVAKLEEMRRKDEEQKRHNQYPPHTMNQLLAGSISATPNSSSSLPFGLKNPIEPPSIQSSYHHNYTSQPPQEHRTIGTKRPYTSTLEMSLVPPTHSQASPFPSSLFGRLLQPSTNDAHTASIPSTNDCHRDGNWGTPLGLNTRKFNSDNAGTCHYNFPPFASPSLPPPPTHDAAYHDVTEERKSESSGYDHHNKPFYNFMKVEDPEDLKETGHGSNHDGGGDAIDLKLKL